MAEVKKVWLLYVGSDWISGGTVFTACSTKELALRLEAGIKPFLSSPHWMDTKVRECEIDLSLDDLVQRLESEIDAFSDYLAGRGRWVQ